MARKLAEIIPKLSIVSLVLWCSNVFFLSLYWPVLSLTRTSLLSSLSVTCTFTP
ncbi:hypothetical protein HYC85_025649 [Camellia sinensis]|uniref:Uncharacterized protein n=1 Tax=Camellia sinensis TaxID=4442 RepID=A0A7J7GBM1_CAMSI|nr:hypothetical protein HYC85_025649 [Camellia sinensis]